MTQYSEIDGKVTQTDCPDWQPLESLVGNAVASWFMWMHEIRLGDGSEVHAYKHVATRRYLHVGNDGRAFELKSEGMYVQLNPAISIVRAFAGWESAAPAPCDIRALREAVHSARAAVVGLSPLGP